MYIQILVFNYIFNLSIPRTRAGDLRSPKNFCSICFNNVRYWFDDSNQLNAFHTTTTTRLHSLNVQIRLEQCVPLSTLATTHYSKDVAFVLHYIVMRKNIERNVRVDGRVFSNNANTYLYFPFSLSTLNERPARCEGIEIHVNRGRGG